MRALILLKTSLVALLALSASFTPALADDNDTPPWSMADEYWGEDAMKAARDKVQHKHGNLKNYMIMGDRLEWQDTGGDGTFLWDAQGWYGGDIDKLYIKTEGEYAFDDSEFEDAEVQALWSRAVSPFWDVQAGLRYDLEPKGRTHAVLGVQGLAPYWFEVDAAAFLSTDGDLSARAETEYDLRFTQRLTLQPRAELNFSAQDIPELQIGAGLSSFDAGLRLRYEIRREFAPYVGLEWQKSLGDTADLVRADGGDPDNILAVIGLRAWF